MQRTNWSIALIVLYLSLPLSGQTGPNRGIDQCPQDGLYFYALSDDVRVPIQVERNGIKIRIEHPNPPTVDATITFSRGGHKLVQHRKDFEAAQGWLTVGGSGFAQTWSFTASSSSTQLFQLTAGGDIIEDRVLILEAERDFYRDAKRVCRRPGINTTAIKWIDKDHLLLSINAWSSLFCQSNFTEGFIVDLSSHRVQQKLSEQQMIDMPGVCTWNLAPATEH